MIGVDKAKGIWRTYSLIRRLSSIDGSTVNKNTLDCVMYNVETLPPLGKEYWWSLFSGQDGERPIQFMLLIFRKHGKKMLFNDKTMMFEELERGKFQAVTSGWVYDGEKLHDLGDTNAAVEIHDRKIVSEISGQKLMLSGGFPNYDLVVGDLIDLKITKGNYLKNKNATGVFLPPFGVGWIDIFSNADGVVLGKNFRGTAHLQKVDGVTIFGPFHWGRVVFQNGSSTSLFCLKTGENSKRLFHKSIKFFDTENNEIIQFNNPKLEVSKTKNEWVIEGKGNDKSLRMVLEIYATKRYDMKGGGSQVYIEYAVIPKEFNLKIKGRTITLDNTGRGVGTFEDAYW